MPRSLIRTASIACAALTAVVLATAFEWPADAGAYRLGFGTPKRGLLRGVELRAADGVIKAAADGELTFVVESTSLPGGYPVSWGGMVVLSHASDMTTIYSGLQRGSISSYLKNVRKGDILGSPSTAHTDRGIMFYTFDAKERRFINPLIVMPSLGDDKAPVVRSAALSLDGVESSLDQPRPVRQGAYWLLVDAIDMSPAGIPSAPFEVRAFIDGTERGRIVYDAVWAAGGSALLFGVKGLREDAFLSSDGRMRFGPFSLPRGRAVMTITVSDYAGNTREQTYSVSVQ